MRTSVEPYHKLATSQRHKAQKVKYIPVSVYCAIRTPTTTTYAGLARWLQPGPSMPVPSMNVWKTKCPVWCVGAAARIAMMSATVPTACHHTEMLFRYLSKCTPKVLMSPWAMRTAA